MEDTISSDNWVGIDSYIAENDCVISNSYMVTNGSIGIYFYIITYFAVRPDSSKSPYIYILPKRRGRVNRDRTFYSHFGGDTHLVIEFE